MTMELPLRVYPLDERITAFTTTRHGGVSKGSYASFNINPYCGDDPDDVAENRRILAATLSLPAERIILPHQVHGAKVEVLTESDLRLDSKALAEKLEGVDGLITAERNLCVGVSTADCVPLILYDPVHHVAGAVHAGWRGTVQQIACHALRQMQTHFSTSAEEVKAVIAPCISMVSFEVGEEVYEAFSAAHFPMRRIARKYGEKWHIDLPEANAFLLERCGVRRENILFSNECTMGNSQDFFSARRHTISSGRLYTGFVLK